MLQRVWGEILYENLRSLDLKVGGKYFTESDIHFLRDVIGGERQIRDDYQELTQLITILLGSLPPAIYCSAPGPVRMQPYALKIVQLQDQRDVFNLTKAEESQLKKFVLFGTPISSLDKIMD